MVIHKSSFSISLQSLEIYPKELLKAYTEAQTLWHWSLVNSMGVRGGTPKHQYGLS